MKLKAVLDEIDGLDEALQPLYAEDDRTGKFVLQVLDFDDHPTIRGVITANRENLARKDELKKTLDKLQARLEGLPEDFTAETYAELKARVEAQGDEPAQLAGQKELYEERIARQKAAFEAERAALAAERDDARAALEGRVIEEGLRSTLREAGVDVDLLDGAMALLKPKVKVKRDGAEVSAIVETDLGEQALAEFVDSWTQGKTGARYMAKAEGPNAPGGGRAGVIGENPFSSKTWNKTAQTRVPVEKRETLAKAAGFPDYATAIRAIRPLTPA